MVRAPFEIVQRETIVNNLISVAWHIAPYCLQRMRVYSDYPRTKIATKWGYWKQAYLGQMIYSIEQKKFVWRKP